ncbi:hypothetical protein SAMN07250955_107226 [Arboricoccus pini]|uniref:Uncharacterized protein n=1 Tax=Arboricoccus pini TaxID=1963835 RepID=A0A212RE14_9PROT|nr:hypothetical protein [Arboricoccus pini]SNB70545.1 hypothetical protein SAMN07250955_107226 [Arboricoccus pini]
MKRLCTVFCLAAFLAAPLAPALAQKQPKTPDAQSQDCARGVGGPAEGGGPIQGGRQIQPTRSEVEDRLSSAGCQDVDQSAQDAKDVDRIYKQLMGEDAKTKR